MIHLYLRYSDYGSRTFVCDTLKELITLGDGYKEFTGVVAAGSSADGSTSIQPFFVNDYEEKPRVLISVGIIAVVDLTSLVCVMTMIIDNSIVMMGVSLGVAILTNTFAIYAFYAWYKRTMRLYSKRFSWIDDDNGFTDAYSLRKRFQIQENIRVVQLIKRIYIVSLAFLVLCIAVILPMLVADALSFRNFVIEGMDIAIAAFANVISLVILSGSPAFRGSFKLLYLGRRSAQVEDCNGSGVRNAFGTQLMIGQRDEAEVYFQQLRATWDKIS